MTIEEQKAVRSVLAAYGTLYEASRESTPFHSPKWLQCCLHLVPGSDLRFLVLSDAGETLGMMPYVAKRMGPVVSVFSLPYGTFGGFLLKEVRDLSPLSERLGTFLSPSRGMSELVDYGSTLPELPGFEIDRKTCHVLDLHGGYEAVWEARYDRTQRKTQRSARSQGVCVREITTEADLRDFYRLYSTTYGSKGSNVFSLEDLTFMFETLGTDTFRGLLATHEGTPVAGTVSLFHPSVTVGFLQGSSSEHRSLRAVNLLIDEAIQDAIRRQGASYNLGVTPRGASGVMKFKESFGAAPRKFPVHVRRDLLYRIKSRLGG